VSILPFNPTVQIFTEASKWGAHVGETLLHGVWSCKKALHAHQQLGDVSSDKDDRPSTRNRIEPSSDAVHGQHIRSVLHQPSRRNTLPIAVSTSVGDTDEVTQSTHRDEGRTHSGLQKCTGGLTFKIGLDHLNRMDPASGDIPSAPVSLGHTPGRSVRDEVQCTAADVHFAV
jgi:hypothetical protein